MGEVSFATEPIDRLEFTEVGALAKLEPKTLNNGPSRLEVDVGFLGVKTQCSVVSNVLLKGDGTSCLLYTSPSPRDLSTSRMPSSA